VKKTPASFKYHIWTPGSYATRSTVFTLVTIKIAELCSTYQTYQTIVATQGLPMNFYKQSIRNGLFTIDWHSVSDYLHLYININLLFNKLTNSVIKTLPLINKYYKWIEMINKFIIMRYCNTLKFIPGGERNIIQLNIVYTHTYN